MLGEQGRVTCYRSSPVSSEEARGRLTPGFDPCFDALLEDAYENDDWDLNSSMRRVRTACRCDAPTTEFSEKRRTRDEKSRQVALGRLALGWICCFC